jgi:hypothetical protein
MDDLKILMGIGAAAPAHDATVVAMHGRLMLQRKSF